MVHCTWALTRSLLVLSLLGSTVVTSRAADEIHIPPVAHVADIQFAIYPGWFLGINADGSGSIGYGSHAKHVASVPAGTFDFEKVYRSLAPTVRASGDMRESASIIFHQRHVTPAAPMYTEDTKLVLGLFDTAKQNAVGLNVARVHGLWEQLPPSLEPVD